MVKDAIKLILKCLKKDFIGIIFDNKEDIELKEKINKLEDLLNIEKKEKQNLLQQNTKLAIKLKEFEEIINNLLQENSNLNKKINELEEFSKKNFTYLSKNINNLEYDKLITDYNNLKNDYDKLMNNYNIILDDKNKLRREYEDLKNHSNNNNNKIANKDKCVNFNSTDQTINYAIPCSGDSTFAEIEELLYKEYPDYRETNNIFLANGKEILRFKSINDNNIGTGKPILLVKP